ncbi:MAG: hypothetical protein WEB85_14950 [Dongiaceae bacterium]
MDGFKSILASKTFWGALLAIAAGVLGMFGFDLPAADQATLLDYVGGGGAMVGGVIAIVGRVVASKKIG